jgi:hypothetical protein
MLSSTASHPLPARRGRPQRRAPVRDTHRSLFDLLLDQTYPWAILDEQHTQHAIQILARLIAQAVRESPEKEKNHD